MVEQVHIDDRPDGHTKPRTRRRRAGRRGSAPRRAAPTAPHADTQIRLLCSPNRWECADLWVRVTPSNHWNSFQKGEAIMIVNKFIHSPVRPRADGWSLWSCLPLQNPSPFGVGEALMRRRKQKKRESTAPPPFIFLPTCRCASLGIIRSYRKDATGSNFVFAFQIRSPLPS
jgi:hypothetical protein